MDQELEYPYLLVDVITIVKDALMKKHGIFTMEMNLHKKQ